MESKKEKKVDLKAKRGIFQAIGVLLSLSFVLLAFEWNFSSGVDETGSFPGTLIEEDPTPLVRIKEKPKPPKVNKQVEFKVVENNVELANNNLDKYNTETNLNEIMPDPFGDEGEGEDFNEPVDLPPFKPGELEYQAKFPGGEKALLKFVKENTVYPRELKEIGIGGKVWIKFVINKRGKVSDIEVLRSPDKALSRAAVKTIKSLPDWEPAKQNGKNVSMYFTIPINFIVH